MNSRLYVLMVLTLLGLECSAVNAASSEYGSSSRHFEVSNDPTQVEETAVAYAKSKRTSNVVTSKIASIIKSETKMCGKSNKFKIAFCAELYRMEYYGLRFEAKERQKLKCRLQRFTGKSINTIESNNLRILMFSCPDIFYTDLETNEKTPWTYRYHISNAKEADAALVFSQVRGAAEFYPKLYASHIEFENFKFYSPKEKTDIPSLGETKIGYRQGNRLDDKIFDYIGVRQVRKPYRKFSQLISSLNVCGLRRSDKIHLCRQLFDYLYGNVPLNVHDFDEEKCKNHTVDFDYRIDFNSLPKNNLYVLHCTSILSMTISRFTDRINYYISSNTDDGSVNILVRSNKKGEKLTPKLYIKNSRTSPMVQDMRRKRLSSWPSERERNRRARKKSSVDVVNELNEIENDIQTPSTVTRMRDLKFTTQSAQTITEPLLVDDVAIAFSKVKTTKLMYRKFRTTYSSTDVCQLTQKQKADLCNEILAGPEYRLERVYFSGTFVKHPCVRAKVYLNLRETENLEKDNFTMWLCPHFFVREDDSYFIGKANIKNTVMIFTSYTRYKNFMMLKNNLHTTQYYPHALVTKIKKVSVKKKKTET